MERPGEAIERLHAVRRLLQQCNAAACARHGLSQTEAAVLLYLYNNPGRDSASDIVAYRNLPKANGRRSRRCRRSLQHRNASFRCCLRDLPTRNGRCTRP